MKTLSTIFALLFSASTLLSAEPDHVAILLCERTEKALAEPLRTYMADVEQRFPVKLQVVARDWKTPEEVRQAIKSLHREKALSGAILVGAIPMHHFFMHEHPNPNPLYYEDFELPFVDNNKDGVDDAYKGKPELKVWVSSIRATEKANQDDIPALRQFFAKTHDYYTGKNVPELRTRFFQCRCPHRGLGRVGRLVQETRWRSIFLTRKCYDPGREIMHSQSCVGGAQKTQLLAHLRCGAFR